MLSLWPADHKTSNLRLAKKRSLFWLHIFQTFYLVVLLPSDLRRRNVLAFLQLEFQTTRALAIDGIRQP